MPKLKPSIKEHLGNFDLLPNKLAALSRVKSAIRAFSAFYGFEPIETSVIEDSKTISALSRAGFLDERPPYICRTKNGIEIALSPSPMISILRAYISHKMNDFPHPLKFNFDGAGFFAGAGGSGTLEILWESGLVMIGEETAVAEAEMIQILCKALEELGIKAASLELRINAVGCENCRNSFRSAFTSHLRSRLPRLCKKCKRSFKKSPVKILVCEEEKCKMTSSGVPQVLDYLCEDCRTHLSGILEFFDEYKIPYFLDSKFFKDGSWYDTFIFELLRVEKNISEEGNEKIFRVVVAEGGRISRTGAVVAGKKIDAVGLSVSTRALERIFVGGEMTPDLKPKVFLVQLGDLAKRKSFAIMEALRKGEISVKESLGRDSIKSQLRLAEVVGAEIVLILGQKEALDGTIIVRELGSGMQETIPQDKLVEFLKRKLKK